MHQSCTPSNHSKFVCLFLQIFCIWCLFPLLTIFEQKKLRSKLILSRYWWPKNPAIWLAAKHTWLHPMKSCDLRCYIFLMIKSMQKKWYHLILSRDFEDQRIQKFDWIKGTTGHSQIKKVVRDATFLWQ